MGYRKCVYCKEKYHAKSFTDDPSPLCGECEGLIKEALQAREQAKEAKSRASVIVALPECDHWWPGFYHSLPRDVSTWDDAPRTKLRSAFARLYRVVGTPMPKPIKGVWPWNGEFAQGQWDARKVQMTLKQYRTLKYLRLLVEKVIDETYEGAIAEGRSILYQLNSGGLTPEQLSKKDVERAERIQERKRELKREFEG